MDNEASAALKLNMATMNIKYQLVLPSNHIENNSEREIQTFKNHFIARLCSVDKDFHVQLWERLLEQAKIRLNLLRQSRILPHISAYIRIFRSFDFNRTPLVPPGTKIFMHNRPNDCALWAPHVEGFWYIELAMEHYRFHKAYVPKTRSGRISDTV